MEQLLEKLVELWMYDVHIFSKWWLYAPLCIPALFYLVFFFIKWSVLTAPVWLIPASIIVVYKEMSTNTVVQLSTETIHAIAKQIVAMQNEKMFTSLKNVWN